MVSEEKTNSHLRACMELSLLSPLLCLLQLTSMALASHPDSDLKPLAGKENLSRARTITTIFHPPSSSCVLRKSVHDPLNLGPCMNSEPWMYTPQKMLMIKGTYFCLQAADVNKPVKLSIICSPSDSKWEIVEDSSKTHLSTNLADGNVVCLDVNQDGTLVSNQCKRQGSVEGQEDDRQWFDVVTGTPIVDAAGTSSE